MPVSPSVKYIIWPAGGNQPMAGGESEEGQMTGSRLKVEAKNQGMGKGQYTGGNGVLWGNGRTDAHLPKQQTDV